MAWGEGATNVLSGGCGAVPFVFAYLCSLLVSLQAGVGGLWRETGKEGSLLGGARSTGTRAGAEQARL